MSGALIAFEGLDQSGKETQARLLGEELERQGRSVVPLTFPCYQTTIAMEIERALRGTRDYPPDVLQLLYIANRYEYRERIETWLAGGRVVICDRYLASSIAYGEAQGVDPRWLESMQAQLPQPDITVLLDISPSTALARKAVGRDRFERDLALLGRVRDSYLRQSTGRGWYRLDGERPVPEVAADVAAISRERLPPR
jgi:dTMP kinase